MDEIPAIYEAESLEQVRALANELRTRIFSLLAQEPMTVTQVGKAFDIAPAKIHYHVRELERVGLVRQVFTREKSGILEKYYRAIAKDISVPRSLVTSAPRDELLAAANELAQSAVSGYIRALGRLMPLPDEDFQRYPFSISNSTLWLTRDELDQFAAELRTLLEKYETYRGVEGEQEATFFTVLYPAQLAAEPESLQSRAEAQASERPSDQPPSAREPKINRVWVVGAVSYSRKDLEGVAARGERLDISVLGACSFSSDIPADLVDRTVARFRCRGPVSASPAVRDVLKMKEPR
ncbi:MAG TPA: helix-turn-helix domain-containing protein [Ktedonobacterales bacterium]|jgi:DNA-binding transcriptional ArsR family regulator